MTLKSIFRDILFYLSVPYCISCGERLNRHDVAFCPKCSLEFREIASRNCSVCNNILVHCSCSCDYLESLRVKRVVKVFRYNNRPENMTANRLIYSLKGDDRFDVTEYASDVLCEAIRNSFDTFDNVVITNVPRRKRAIVKFGYDHAARLARATARKLGAEYADLLRSRARAPQKAKREQERRINAKFCIKRRMDLTGKTVIIVDDVITTGSSVGACATLLRQMKPREIAAASLAIAYKDKYVPPLILPF